MFLTGKGCKLQLRGQIQPSTGYFIKNKQKPFLLRIVGPYAVVQSNRDLLYTLLRLSHGNPPPVLHNPWAKSSFQIFKCLEKKIKVFCDVKNYMKLLSLSIKINWNTTMHSFTYCLQLPFHYEVRIELLQQRRNGPQSRRYLLPALQKSLLTPGLETGLGAGKKWVPGIKIFLSKAKHF